MKFTIIVPMYNVKEYIAECIESVLKQTFRDFELILIDDESTDGTLELAKKYEKIDGRIVLLTKKHGGLPQTRNYGLRVAKGEYIMLLDGDDYFALDHLEKTSIIVEKYNCDMSIGNNHVYFTELDQSKIVLFPYRDDLNKMDLNAQIKFVFDKQNLLPACAVLTVYKREFLEKNNIRYGERYSCSEDLDIFMHSISQVRSICFFDHEFYYYRQDNCNAMTKNMTAGMLKSRLEIHKKWYDYFNSKVNELPYAKDICDILRNSFITNIDFIRFYHSSDKNCLKKFIRDNDYIWIYGRNTINNYYLQYYFLRPVSQKKNHYMALLSALKRKLIEH